MRFHSAVFACLVVLCAFMVTPRSAPSFVTVDSLVEQEDVPCLGKLVAPVAIPAVHGTPIPNAQGSVASASVDRSAHVEARVSVDTTATGGGCAPNISPSARSVSSPPMTAAVNAARSASTSITASRFETRHTFGSFARTSVRDVSAITRNAPHVIRAALHGEDPRHLVRRLA